MSSSISNSKQAAFVAWVFIILAFAWCAVRFAPWGGSVMSPRNYIDFAAGLGSETDYLILGDSKSAPFATDCLIPWLRPYRGAVFSANSVTPVFHWYTLKEIWSRFPEFRPKVIFIFIGANNMNANGLHARRDFTFFNQVSLLDAWDLSGARGARLLFAEVVLARIFPVYGYRIQITHLEIGDRVGQSCPAVTESSYAHEESFQFDVKSRDPVADRNYYDIYRRSVYADYEPSVVQAGALEYLIRLVRDFNGIPILVLPPVASEMWALEQDLVGKKFDETIDLIVEKTGVELLDLRDVTNFEFRDVNHLSEKGAFDVAHEYFRPILESNP